MTLAELLAQCAGLYDDLLDAAPPVKTGEPLDYSPDPRSKPTPGRLGVIDHRHELVRGLRWWVDAVREDSTRVGESVHAMTAYLCGMVWAMAPEDRDTLTERLTGWRRTAWRLADRHDDQAVEFDLPPEAYARVVPQKTAAQVFGVPVSTIWRRNGGKGGPVKLGDVAPRCGHCELIVGQCEHTR